MNRRQLLLAAPAALLATNAVAADPWPSRPIRIIVPFPPGGPADGSARVLAESMGPALGANIVVENRTGGGGVIGITAAAQSNDGHTLLMGSTSMTVTPSMRTDLPYDIFRDFQPIGMVSAQPLVLVVPAASPLRSVEDVIRTGKKKGDLTAGTSGIGTLSHLAIELFNMRTATEIVHVPYRGENAILPDLLNSTIDLGFLNLPILLPQLQAGKLRALAVSAKASITELPDVKTFKAQNIDGLEVGLGGSSRRTGHSTRGAAARFRGAPQGARDAFGASAPRKFRHDARQQHPRGTRRLPPRRDGALGRGRAHPQHQAGVALRAAGRRRPR
jgi:tripartite-type tricarboxylate transporter receptor subunit TctC